MLKYLFRPTNRRVRLMVGVFLAVLFCIQCTRTEAFRESRYISVMGGKAFGKNAPDVVSEIETLAKSNHIALLEKCLKNYEASYRDFTCTFIKQERIRGTLKAEQHINVKHLTTPFSVSLQWTRSAPTFSDAVLYVEGKYDNQFLARLTGLIGLIVPSRLEKPESDLAMKNTLRSVNQFGFGRSLKSLIDVYKQADKAGDLKTSFGGYAQVGGNAEKKIPGRKCLVLIRHLPAKDDYPAYKTVTYIDVDYLVPLCIEGFDWDNKLLCRYLYRDLKFNVALTPDDFTPEANKIAAPKT